MKLRILLIAVLFFGFSYAQESLSAEEQHKREKNIQAGNPFKKFGYKPKIATLSKGKYLEWHDLDTIVRIGSFLYHVKQKQLWAYEPLKPEDKGTLSPEISSRWISPDPLMEEFPEWSPYNFTLNNPIRFVDPDGRMAIPFDWVYNKETNEYIWDSSVTSSNDMDLAANSEYVGISHSDIDAHYQKNSNWLKATFSSPDINVSSFKKHIGSELNDKISSFVETGETQQLDNIRGLYENFDLINGVTNYGRFKFDLSFNVDNKSFKGGYFDTKLFPNRELNFISGEPIFEKAKWNGKLDKTRGFPYEIKMGNNLIDQFPIHIYIDKNSEETYNKIESYYD